ncbi:MAG: nicotinate-nucleotide pyrophosphorylase (carboxylating) [Lysobacterales bacterium]
MTIPEGPDISFVSADVSTALKEDLGDGDRTASLIGKSTLLNTRVICRQHAVLAGQAWFDQTFHQLNGDIIVNWNLADGESMHPDQEVCSLSGPAAAILSGERTALNFIQTLSATATLAKQYVKAVSGTSVTILDTRKTLPGLRMAQKYAVLCGGASNHRIGLFDAILIKENHIAAVGSITAAINRARSNYPDLLLEVEVENLEQLKEASEASADRALLDNFSVSTLRTAVEQFSGRIQLEASGGVSLNSVREIAETGVDFISTGDITKNIQAVDFSMRYI